MVKITLCDRCGKDFTDEYDFITESILSARNMIIKENTNEVNKFQLCDDCIVGYNEIIDNTNNILADFLKEKEEPKKKNFLKKLFK